MLTWLDFTQYVLVVIINLINTIRVIDMVKNVTAMKVRQNLGDLLNNVHYCKDPIVITKAGKPFAALVDIELFEKIHLLRDEFDKLSNDIAIAYEGVNERTVNQHVDEALKSIRDE